MSPSRSRVFAFALGALAALFIVLAPSTARAFPWMIRHGYTACVPCHADPSGGGILTQYGQAQGEILLATRYGKAPTEEVGPGGRQLWGVVDLPDWLLVSGSFRGAWFFNKTGDSPDL